jgi:hypothetical protein
MFYPITRTDAVVDLNGRNLEDIISNDINNDYINVNRLADHFQEYDRASDARNDVPADFRYEGVCITYLLSDGWHLEQFIGTDVSEWSDNTKWENVRTLTVFLTEDEYDDLVDQGKVRPDVIYMINEND